MEFLDYFKVGNTDGSSDTSGKTIKVIQGDALTTQELMEIMADESYSLTISGLVNSIFVYK